MEEKYGEEAIRELMNMGTHECIDCGSRNVQSYHASISREVLNRIHRECGSARFAVGDDFIVSSGDSRFLYRVSGTTFKFSIEPCYILKCSDGKLSTVPVSAFDGIGKLVRIEE